MEKGGKLKRKGYTIGQFSKFVRPGYFRIDATYQPKSGVFVVAFKGTDQNIVVVINQSKVAKSQTFTFKNDTIFSVKKYVTSASKNINDEGTLECNSNSFTDNLEAQSINTYVTSKISTGVSSVKTPEIHIFPNPASDILQLSSVENVTSYQVFNLLGQPLIIQSNPQSSSIDISSLNSGIYLIKVGLKEGEKCFRFVKK